MSPPTACPNARAPAAKPALPDEILEDIFILLEDAADLARAWAACTCFRRVVSGRRFRRRYMSLHPPPILGLLDFSSGDRGFHPAQPPRCSAAAVRAVRAFTEAADFNFSFLPSDSTCSWHVRDFRDGRFLLSRYSNAMFFSEDLVVCDPVHRRYLQIPGGILGDLAASIGLCGKDVFDPFLAPVGQEDDEPSIHVICNVISKFRSKVGTFIFSSVTGNWRYVMSFGIVNHMWMACPVLLTRRYAHGCFYWMQHHYSGARSMFVFDTFKMKLSVVELPPEAVGRDKIIVEAGEVRIGLFILDGSKLSFYTRTIWQDNAKDWQLANVITLHGDYNWSIPEAEAEGQIVLRGFPRGPPNNRYLYYKTDAHYFTVNIKTFSVERLAILKYESRPSYLYIGLPPPLSPPSV